MGFRGDAMKINRCPICDCAAGMVKNTDARGWEVKIHVECSECNWMGGVITAYSDYNNAYKNARKVWNEQSFERIWGAI